MDTQKKKNTALKILSGIVMAVFLIGGLASVLTTGRYYASFFNWFAILLRSEHWFLPSAISTIMIKTVGAFMLMWSFFLYKLIQDPEKNAIIATGTGIGFIILSAVTVSHFLSREIMTVVPSYIIAWRVFVTALVGLLFLIWTPKQ